MSLYRNNGAPWERPDGSTVARGAEFEPTADERLRKAYKLEYLGPDGKAAPRALSPKPRDELAEYEQGNGWYLLGGEKIHGREAAEEKLKEIKAEEQRQRVAFRLDGP